MIYACFLMLFCLTCKSVPKNWHICVNKGPIYIIFIQSLYTRIQTTATATTKATGVTAMVAIVGSRVDSVIILLLLSADLII